MNLNHATAVAHHPKPVALVADAHEDTRRLHVATLASVTAEIEEAEDGAEALAKAIRRRPGLVVTDARLPRIDGFALCALLRNDPMTRHATIIVVTSNERDVVRARHAGADEVIVKPVTPEQVLSTAAELVRRGRDMREGAADPQSAEEAPPPREHETSEWAQAVTRRMSRTYPRVHTTTPPNHPPDLRCPSCDAVLAYRDSFVGGVSALFPEQWDYLECAACGLYQYRHRTRKLRPA